jgi:hypothetical protein
MSPPNSDVVYAKIPKRLSLTFAQSVGILIAIGTVGITAFWLHSDKHNGEIFVPRAEYSKDQKVTEEKLNKIDRSQEEMNRDIKEILKHMNKGNP